MTSRTIKTVGILTGATLACSAMAQTTIYTQNFDTPPFAVGSIDQQLGWTTVQNTSAGALSLAPGLLQLSVTNASAPGPQAGNGYYRAQNEATTSQAGFFAFQANGYPTGGTGTANWPLIDAIRAAEAASATAIEFSVYVVPPTPATVGTSPNAARHGMTLFVTDATGTSFKSATGFQVRAGDRQVGLTQWLDVGQLGVTTAGNYWLTFNTPVIIPETGYSQISCRWTIASGLPEIKVGAGDWLPGLATSTAGGTADEFRMTVARGSAGGTFGGVQAVATSYMDTLVVSASVPAYPQCTASAGECDTAHAGGGCNIITCCESVCGLIPDCCAVTWDQTCADLAVPTCNLYVYNCTSPGTPSNNCAISPTVLSSLPATVAYDTTTATTDGPPEVGCGSGNNDLPIHKDVWYRFQAPTAGTLIASNCTTGTFGGSGNFDSKIAAYNLGSNLAAFDPQLLPDYYIGCNEDCSDPIFTSELTVNGIVAGNYYLVRLGGYEGASGAGNIYIGIQPPPNPCDAANLIQGVAGVNVVTVDPLYPDLNMQTFCNFAAGTQNIAKAKFIKFTPAASGAMTVRNCADTGTTVDARLAVLTTCGDVASTIACDDDGCTGAAPYTSTLTVNVNAGQPVYIAVGGYDATQTGPFNVEIVAPTAPPCPADLNGDGAVNGADLGLMLGAWGACPGCAADLNADGVVNGADLGLLLGSWGACA